MASGSMQ